VYRLPLPRHGQNTAHGAAQPVSASLILPQADVLT
jgi:hypothetical protein